ncbi:MAG: hypothetical protein AVDCRST_MAG73-790 [uncultured Thermomicrobiales bacterium]|uniref:Uncharacterized protein n=1 Tax=uncultured Thermomicrobiales bacterium TaxID=1645740 RepID=A0A6J4TQJ4_9BACT|nr:MAG: hypothetical protein AVDCRST_MAG73-790 [uncultured Thermomicrobiales bacterium]
MSGTDTLGSMSDAEIDAIARRKAYLRVYALLIRAAEGRATVTYPVMAAPMGLPPSGQHMARETGRMLEAIEFKERACGRPMLSAVVVKTGENRPGPGFYALARRTGRLAEGATHEEERAFWAAELERVYAEWGA